MIRLLILSICLFILEQIFTNRLLERMSIEQQSATKIHNNRKGTMSSWKKTTGRN